MPIKPIDWQHLSRRVAAVEPLALAGRVQELVGLIVKSRGPECPVGSICRLSSPLLASGLLAEVVGFRQDQVLLMPYGEVQGLGPQMRVVLEDRRPWVRVGPGLLGRVLDGLGAPLDDEGPLKGLETAYPLYGSPLNPCSRQRISQPLDVGVRAINGLLTLGRGQRMGIFAGSGVGKSTLMGMICRNTTSPISVIALIGERGREVREFIEESLGAAGLARAVVVAATSDAPPLVRLRGAYLATTIAEYFRDQGQDVILMLDSLTRFAMAAREIGLAVGEPPTARGYTPSVFTRLPALLERAGTCQGPGSITGIYTVLVEGDDLLEPIADAARAILDGHIVLSRDLADRGHYPAIDILGSISRLMSQVTAFEHRRLRDRLVAVLAAYRQAEDLIHLNAYARGSNPEIDFALNKIEAVTRYLRQEPEEAVSLAQALQDLEEIFLT